MTNRQITISTTDRIKNIMRNHINNRTAKSTTIDQIMFEIANKGYMQARVFLNSYCLKKYEEQYKNCKPLNHGPLVDFEGNPIKISRKGFFTPVDAILEYKNGKNILTMTKKI